MTKFTSPQPLSLPGHACPTIHGGEDKPAFYSAISQCRPKVNLQIDCLFAMQNKNWSWLINGELSDGRPLFKGVTLSCWTATVLPVVPCLYLDIKYSNEWWTVSCHMHLRLHSHNIKTIIIGYNLWRLINTTVFICMCAHAEVEYLLHAAAACCMLVLVHLLLGAIAWHFAGWFPNK